MRSTLARSIGWLLAPSLILTVSASPAWSQLPKKKGPAPAARKAAKPPDKPPEKPVAAPAPRSALLTREAWQNAPRSPIQPGEIDALVLQELRKGDVMPAPLTTDEQFL